MIKRLVLLTLVVFSLFGCTPFQFGFNKKDDKKIEALDSQPIIDITLSANEISQFNKKTDSSYEEIVASNRAILPNSIFAGYKTDPCLWTNLNPVLNNLINLEMKSAVTPQQDAQKYINLMLSLLDESREYRAVVVETDAEPAYFVGRYIFIGRKEIESCRDEAVLAEVLSFRLLRNVQINRRFELKHPLYTDKSKKLAEIIKVVKSEWEIDYESDVNSHIYDSVMLIMRRAGFEPSRESVNESDQVKEYLGRTLKFVKPLQRHNKVFD